MHNGLIEIKLLLQQQKDTKAINFAAQVNINFRKRWSGFKFLSRSCIGATKRHT